MLASPCDALNPALRRITCRSAPIPLFPLCLYCSALPSSLHHHLLFSSSAVLLAVPVCLQMPCTGCRRGRCPHATSPPRAHACTAWQAAEARPPSWVPAGALPITVPNSAELVERCGRGWTPVVCDTGGRTCTWLLGASSWGRRAPICAAPSVKVPGLERLKQARGLASSSRLRQRPGGPRLGVGRRCSRRPEHANRLQGPWRWRGRG